MIKLFRKKLNKWLKVSDLKIGMKIAVPKAEVFSNYCGKKADNDLLEKGEGDIMWDEIVEIKKLKEERVYDIEVEGTHNFIAGHLIDSETGKQLSREEEREYLGRPAAEILKPMLSRPLAEIARPKLKKGQREQREPLSKTGETSVVGRPWFGGIFAHNTYISGGLGVNRTSPAAGSIDISGTYLTNGADYAEYFYTIDTDLEPGEAVCVDVKNENAVMRCTRCGDGNLMGIVSSNPSIVGNGGDNKEDNPNYKIIGMLGQVPAKVSTENGAIRPGDSLTSASSTPGVLMKARAGDPTVGVALQQYPSALTGTSPSQGEENVAGKINVLISRRNKSITVEEVEEKVQDRIAAMEIEDEVNILISDAIATLNLDDEINNQIDPKLLTLETKLTVETDDLSGQIINIEDSIKTLVDSVDKLNSDLSKSQLLISSLESLFDEAILNLTDRIVGLESSFIVDEEGNIRMGNVDCAETEVGTGQVGTGQVGTGQCPVLTEAVAIVEIETATSTLKTAFVVNQVGEGDVVDFRVDDVSIMNVNNNGKVSVVGEFLVDGRIMVCSGGVCGETLDGLVDETMGDMGIEGKVVAGAFEGYCEDGFVWVPGSSKYGTGSGFCFEIRKRRVKNTEETNDHEINEEAEVLTGLSQGEAQMACQSIGDDYHLVTENEWLTIAENILRVNENDIDSEKDGLQLSYIASSSEAIASTTEYKLSNGNIVYELVSEIGEWTDQTITASGNIDADTEDWTEYSLVNNYNGYSNIAPAYYLSHKDNNIGLIRTGGENENTLRGFVRGTNGIYSLDLSYSPATATSTIGFRCAK
jgi:hypothetical protein